MSFSPFDPRRSVAIILGARVFPNSPSLELHGIRFSNSAIAFRNYLLDDLLLERQNVLDLFDDNDSPSEILSHISSFLKMRDAELKKEETPLQDLLFYYVGHGFLEGKGVSDLCLALRSTDTENLKYTALEMEGLAAVIRSRARFLRRYLILDCCYAAAASRAWSQADGPAKLAMSSSLHFFPSESPNRGTAMLSAAEANREANALGRGGFTAFTDALLECLKRGRPEVGEKISLQNLHAMILEYLKENYTGRDSYVRPKVESPESSEGDVAWLPVFPNPACNLTYEEMRMKDSEAAVRKEEAEEAARKQEAEAVARKQEAEEAARQPEAEAAPPKQEVGAVAPHKRSLAWESMNGESRQSQPPEKGTRKRRVTWAMSILVLILFLSAAAKYWSLYKLFIGAKGGDPEQQYQLAKYYESGPNPIETDQMAFEWYTKAANQNHAAASYELARSFEAGLGVSRDIRAAESWYEQAKSNGSRSAEYEIGVLYRLQLSVLNPRTGPAALGAAIKILNPSNVWGRDRDPDFEYQEALCRLDLLPQSGDRRQDEESALHLLIDAAVSGNSDANVLLAKYYLNSEMLTYNLKNVQDALAVASNARNAEAEYLLGVSLVNYIPTKVRAIALIEEGARDGWPAAMRDIGLAYQLGEVVKTDSQRARKYLQLATDLDDATAARVLASPQTASWDMVGKTDSSEPPLSLVQIQLLLSNHVPDSTINILIWRRGIANPIDREAIGALRRQGAPKSLLINLYRVSTAPKILKL